MPTIDLARARNHAEEAHRRAGCLYGGAPYLVHLDAVAMLVRAAGGTDEAIAAAYLHDVVEDTPWTIERVRELYNERIAAIVWVATGEGARRAEKQVAILAKLAATDDPEARLVKLADRYANHANAAIDRPDLARMYRREAEAFRAAAHRPGEWPALWAAYDRLVAG